jgi:putative membrane protein insertion efficiency factor
MSTLLVLLVRLYQLVLSPFLGGHCRFEPSCSQYFIEAVEVHGAFRGTRLGLKRICRCNPWCTPGCDPVPPREHHPRTQVSH